MPEPRKTDPLADGFELAGWVVDPGANRLHRGDEVQRLEPKAMGVLLCLARQPGRTVSRDEFLDAVWRGRVLTDDALNRVISRLRQAFGDDPRQPQLIETIAKTGYRLLQTPRPLATLAEAAGETAAQRPAHNPAALASASMEASVRAPAAARLRWLPWLALAAMAAVLILIAGWRREAPSPLPLAGLQARPLLGLPGSEHQPAFSPDGRLIAFSWVGADGGNRDIYLLERDGRTPRRLSEGDSLDRAPHFAADGLSVVYAEHSDGDCRIVRIGIAGGATETLARCATPTIYPTPLLDASGEWLIFEEPWPGPADRPHIIRQHLRDGRREALSAPPPGQKDFFPMLDAARRQLVFVRGRGSQLGELGQLGEFWTLDLADPAGTLRQRTRDGARVTHAAVGRAGDLVIASRRLGGQSGLWHVASDDSLHWLGVGPGSGHLQAPAISPDGTTLLFERWEHDTELHWLTPDGVAERLHGGSDIDQSPALAPDGQRIALISARSGRAELWVIEGDRARPLAYHGQQRPEQPRWSADGRRLAYLLPSDERSQVCVLALDASTPNCFDQPGARGLAFAADGNGLLVARAHDDARCDLHYLDLLDGRSRLLQEDAGPGLRVGSDGSLYFTRLGRDGLWRQRPGAEVEKLFDDLLSRSFQNWTVDAEAVWFWQQDNHAQWTSRSRLIRHALADGSRRVEAEATGIGPFAGLERAADGRMLYSASIRTESDLWAIDGWNR